MEYLTSVNIATGIVVVLMLYYLKKLLTSGVGENRFFYLIVIVVLGTGLYLWRSGAAVDIAEMIMDASKETQSLPTKSID